MVQKLFSEKLGVVIYLQTVLDLLSYFAYFSYLSYLGPLCMLCLFSNDKLIKYLVL